LTSPHTRLFQSYFPELSLEQALALEDYAQLLRAMNARINLVSRKDEEAIEVHHVLHSLAIAKVFQFRDNSVVCDLGTGGGLPGIPLAIVFPKVQFVLMDSIGKKVRAVKEMLDDLALPNAQCVQARLEEQKHAFDYIVGRAVTSFPELALIVKGKVKRAAGAQSPSGIVYLKGGDFTEELRSLHRPSRVWNISDFFQEPFFETKKVVWADLG